MMKPAQSPTGKIRAGFAVPVPAVGTAGVAMARERLVVREAGRRADMGKDQHLDQIPLSRVKELAELRNAEAQFYLGAKRMVMAGDAPGAAEQSAEWFHRTVEQGHAGARCKFDELICA